MEFLWFIIIGGIVGAVASKVMNTGTGFMVNVILGVVGGFVGGWIFDFFGWSFGTGNWAHFFTAIIGAVVVLAIAKLFAKKPSDPTA